ncbi:MAG: hypothetical protein IJD92_01270 [Bacilli bacterium]|nr:hypothetical protein [Bacilli bacterium]
MFGDKPMLGSQEITVDEKHRVIVPASTNVEKGEELVLLYDEEFVIYRIYTYAQIISKFEEINRKIKNATNDKEERRYKEQLLKLSKSIINASTVDGNRRFNISNKFTKGDKLNCIGANDHLILELKI